MPDPAGPVRGLFAGLCTFDLVQSVARVPGPNEKVTALEQAVAAGGPATNASVAFAFLGGHATLVTGIGRHTGGAFVPHLRNAFVDEVLDEGG